MLTYYFTFMEEEILDFINRRWKNTKANWTEGNCFWFARILADRFQDLSVYYLPISGHFVAGKNGVYFDVTGKIDLKEPATSLSDIKEEDINWYYRLLRDCIL